MTFFHRVFVWRDAAIRHDGSFPRILRPVHSPGSLTSSLSSPQHIRREFIMTSSPVVNQRDAMLESRSSTRDQHPARRI
jgi:hypothetical protein